MLAALDERGYHRLFRTISSYERKSAPNSNASRLLHLSEAHTLAVVMLAQLDIQVLEAFLMNPLPEESIKHPDRYQHTLVSKPSNDSKEQPGIYANYYAKPDGTGRTKAEYELFPFGINFACGFSDDPRNQLVRGGHQLTNSAGRLYRAVDGESEGDLVDDRVEYAFRGVLNVNRRRVRPHFDASGATQILPRAEVGWTTEMYTRCHEHQHFVLTPGIFALAGCVLLHLFADQDVHMMSRVLFYVVNSEQAANGESIGSQICASYQAYGGFNMAQARIHLGQLSPDY